MKFAAAFAALVLATSASHAADWKLAPGERALTFSGTQTGDKFVGKFSRFDAQVSLDPDRLDDAKIVVTVDIASAATGDKQRDTAMPSKEWFDAARFPQARFESRKVSRAANGYEALGDLTLRGVTKEIRLPFTLAIDGRKAQAKGHVDLKRDVFGVGQGEWATGEWVALEVGVDFDLKGERAE
ncbi:YceI family protein [Rhodoblastus sp. 17X3]|uniref:YceI family protein n=1 Tax=Rhodoblastus sp. 17X3 TaxID=3047026 RepID=UPI0024B67601|nr:YceI family protein [Rhodoblastus sp. 17X3]MDI9849379.1 YceI family protein [Rhodoblastus sp. 17X3]